MKNTTKYHIFTTVYGKCGIVFMPDREKEKIIRIFLKPRNRTTEEALREKFPDAVPGTDKDAEKVVSQILSYFTGSKVQFDLDLFDWSVCTPFQLSVLRTESTIPRGKTASYAWISRQLGKDGKGCQPIGTALAHNPFPIIIPCHRTIKSTREVGDYQGGTVMKRLLLNMEGVKFDPDGKVAVECFLG